MGMYVFKSTPLVFLLSTKKLVWGLDFQLSIQGMGCLTLTPTRHQDQTPRLRTANPTDQIYSNFPDGTSSLHLHILHLNSLHLHILHLHILQLQILHLHILHLPILHLDILHLHIVHLHVLHLHPVPFIILHLRILRLHLLHLHILHLHILHLHLLPFIILHLHIYTSSHLTSAHLTKLMRQVVEIANQSRPPKNDVPNKTTWHAKKAIQHKQPIGKISCAWVCYQYGSNWPDAYLTLKEVDMVPTWLQHGLNLGLAPTWQQHHPSHVGWWPVVRRKPLSKPT